MKRCKAADPPSEASPMDKYDTPLEYYLDCLRQLEYSTTFVELKTCAPPPEVRERVWILGSRTSYTAEQWKADVLLTEPADDTPCHHLKAYFDAFGKTTDAMTKDGDMTEWGTDAKYASAYAKAMEEMVSAGRLDATSNISDVKARPSSEAVWQGLTEWGKASVDVYSALAKAQEAMISEGTGSSNFYPVCDLSQSCSRNKLTVDGTWTTVCTSTVLTSLKDAKIMSGEGMLAVLGQPLNKNVPFLER